PVVPAKSGEVFDYNTVDPACLDILDHPKKGRPLKIHASPATIHIFFRQMQLRMLCDIISQKTKLRLYAVLIYMVDIVTQGKPCINGSMIYGVHRFRENIGFSSRLFQLFIVPADSCHSGSPLKIGNAVFNQTEVVEQVAFCFLLHWLKFQWSI